MRPSKSGNSSRSWMLMADLLLLAFAGALAVAGSFGQQANELRKERDSAGRLMEALQAEARKAQQERDAANREFNSIREERDSARRRMEAAQAEAQKTLRERDRLAAELKEQQEKLARAAAEVERFREAKEKLKLLTGEVERLEEKNRVQAQAAEKARVEAELAADKVKGVHQELLGLKSRKPDRLGKVAVLVDTSGSMDNKSAGGSSRWKLTRDTIRVWLEHLAADEVVLIRFHSRAEKPRAFKVADAAARKQVADEINSWRPEGQTATHDALATAYAFEDIDAVLLFTDGDPTAEIEGRKTGREAIYELVNKHRERRVPINVVGVGQYFDKDFSAVLLELARLSDGSFQGR